MYNATNMIILCGELTESSAALRKTKFTSYDNVLLITIAQYDGPRRLVPELRHPGCYIMKAMKICFCSDFVW